MLLQPRKSCIGQRKREKQEQGMTTDVFVWRKHNVLVRTFGYLPCFIRQCNCNIYYKAHIF